VAAPAIYGHRFGGSYGPESSRAALEQSLRGSVEGLEVDVVLSADGDVVCVHDPLLRIATDLDGWAYRTATQKIFSGRLLDSVGKPSDQHPMSLLQVLDLIPRELPLQLDVKAYADPQLASRTAERCCETVVQHGSAERIEVISFFTEACVAAVRSGVAARLVIWADYAPDALSNWAREHGIEGVSVEGFILSERLCEPIVEAGLTISVGAVNSIEQLKRVLPFQPHIVVSDCPLELRDELDGEKARVAEPG
jgi:glycerophosphoryl diester phosphodiesterase